MSTIRQVAKRAGVSATTVSHVINKTRFVSDDTRGKVLAAMHELGYRPNALARSLRRGETHTLGLILPDSANPFFAEVGRSVEEAAFEHGYSVILCNSEGDIQKENLYVDVLSKKQVDGIIFVATEGQADSLQTLLEQDMPVVLVDRDLPDAQVDAVLTDNHQGGYLATQHLIRLGHRRIACLMGPSFLTPSAYRMYGYRSALEEAGLPFTEELIDQGDFHPQAGKKATARLLQKTDPPTAIFVCNDMMAIGALSALIEAGRQVPNDVAVVGFDDIELATYTIPPLTTVEQPKRIMGQCAIELLLARIASPERPVQRKKLPTTLIIRKSCGAKS
jgi:LacI family transcriptional regulator